MVGERVFEEVSEVKGANLTGVLTRGGEDPDSQRVSTYRQPEGQHVQTAVCEASPQGKPCCTPSLPATRTVDIFV